jgi:hypothetical protein
MIKVVVNVEQKKYIFRSNINIELYIYIMYTYSYILVGSLSGYIAHEYLKKYYPGITKFENNVLWYSFKSYSIINKYKSVLVKKILKLFETETDDNINLYMNGDLVETYTLKEVIYKKTSYPQHNLVLYNYKVPNSEKNNVAVCSTIDELLDNLSDNYSSISRTKIYSAIIKMKSWSGDEYEIDLSDNNYMLEGNKLFDKSFIKYCLKNNIQEELKDEDEYTVTFFDQDMEQVTIDQNNYIILTKDSYKIEKENEYL